MYQGVSLDLGGHQVVEDLGELGQVDVDQLSLEVQTEQRKEVPFLNLQQLVVSLQYVHIHRVHDDVIQYILVSAVF